MEKNQRSVDKTAETQVSTTKYIVVLTLFLPIIMITTF